MKLRTGFVIGLLSVAVMTCALPALAKTSTVKGSVSMTRFIDVFDEYLLIEVKAPKGCRSERRVNVDFEASTGGGAPVARQDKGKTDKNGRWKFDLEEEVFETNVRVTVTKDVLKKGDDKFVCKPLRTDEMIETED